MPRRAGAQFERRGGASIPSLFLLMLLTGREGSWEAVFLVFSVNQETRGGERLWMEGKRKEAGGRGMNVCGRWCRDTKWPMYVYVRVCLHVYERVSSCCLILLSWIFLQFRETILRKPFIKTLVSSSEVSKESQGQRGNPIMF